MQMNITGRGVKLTDAIEDYVTKKINSLEKFFDGIIRADVTVGMESHHHKKGSIFMCECKLDVPGKDLFVSKTENTLYKAIDKVRDHIEAELKKHKLKMRGDKKKRRSSLRAAKEYEPEE